MQAFVDIHCHLLPGVDDGPADLASSIAMAELAVNDGIATVVATPHQLGNFRQNRADDIQRRTESFQAELNRVGVELTVLPGADVRIEEGLVQKIFRGEVLTLAGQGKHLLLELPHEIYLPLEVLLASLGRHDIAVILSHPERNAGLLKQQHVLPRLVDAGCLMQVTAGSLVGTFGPQCQSLAEWMLLEGLVHFVATDAHGPKSRRPLMRRAFERVCELTDEATADDLCCCHPALVVAGGEVPTGRRVQPHRASWWQRVTRSRAG